MSLWDELKKDWKELQDLAEQAFPPPGGGKKDSDGNEKGTDAGGDLAITGARYKTMLQHIKTAGGFDYMTDEEFYFGIWASMLATKIAFTPGVIQAGAAGLGALAKVTIPATVEAAGEAVPG